MAILASLPNPNLFSSLPTTPPPSAPSPPPKPPIPPPKYPPPLKSQRRQNPDPSTNPAFTAHHRSSKYYKPVKPGQKIQPDNDDRAVIVGHSGISYHLPGAPFEFMYSYSETPKAQPLAMREPAFLPFAPPTMPRPWTGKAPMKKSKRNIKLFEPLGGGGGDENPNENMWSKRYEMLRGYEMGKFNVRPRKEVLGAPLRREEIREMVKPLLSSNKQVNLGRDGLTHNMLELIHTHWRRQPVCKVRCLGVPTVDMDNLCRCVEEKSGGKIIHRVGGVLYLFRGRNYDHQKRPRLPIMLWKPATPVYPKLIQDAPEGLTKEEADELRTKGKRLLPIRKLAKNGVYVTLVRDARTAFEGSELVRIDCRGLQPSDYKKIGAKLKELVPCVLLSFDDEQILMWRGREWKSMYRDEVPRRYLPSANGSSPTDLSDSESPRISPKMMALWRRAVESGQASILDEVDVSPDELLSKVEEFESASQAIAHSYPATIYSSGKSSSASRALVKEDEDEDFSEDDDESFDAVESQVPLGSLPIDLLAMQLSDGEDED
ncbi:CRS2-associated factor 2, chloroplastic isoform X2 [Salvia miltiorrhiza]|uniref:CRS2-associated factor 2, chloroplastic isoform X2 n=1 Tax=Salvia miltiorrhiza TaxID=226208 RepID=UPI0025ACEEA1|nr:CRS2-associated factor 2, chloroplastic isoform X2 [Salvia miltiorrhiza]